MDAASVLNGFYLQYLKPILKAITRFLQSNIWHVWAISRLLAPANLLGLILYMFPFIFMVSIYCSYRLFHIKGTSFFSQFY